METLNSELKIFSEKCNSCRKCQAECEFLKRYGKPKEIADAIISGKSDGAVAFECNLCGLCSAVCPSGLDPSNMFLKIRDSIQISGRYKFREHRGILTHERLGISKLLTWYGLPDNCDTVFFPGCALPGSRPSITLKLFKFLQSQIPSLGIVLDCCTKPSHDLGRTAYFNIMFQEMRTFLLENGIKTILVACPNCFKVFQIYGEGLSVRTIYDYLSEKNLPEYTGCNKPVTVHDSCVMRFEKGTQDKIRHLLSSKGIRVTEMTHSREFTLCCGEGGSAVFLSPEISEKWCMLRKQEAEGNTVVTYCAGCSNSLDKYMPTVHILDLIIEPESIAGGKSKKAETPFTYINRLRLKCMLKKELKTSIAGGRTMSFMEFLIPNLFKKNGTNRKNRVKIRGPVQNVNGDNKI